MITLEGFFKPEEWLDAETGAKRNRIVLTATKVYATSDVSEVVPAAEKAVKKTSKKKGE